jgi:predicted TIM-barrel fold metal-dependent hydrolase
MRSLDWTRRDLLTLAGAVLADGLAGGCGHGGGVTPPKPSPPLQPAFIVDPHCHIFNANDIPVAGFIEHFLAGEGWPAVVITILKAPLLALQLSAQTSATLAGGGASESENLMRRLTGEQAAVDPPALFRPSAQDIAGALIGARTNLHLPSRSSVTELAAGLTGLEQLLQGAYRTNRSVRDAFDRKAPDVPSTSGTTMTLEKFAGLPTLVRRIVNYLQTYIKFLAVGFNTRLTIARELINDNSDAAVFVPMLVDFDYWQEEARAPVSPARQIAALEALSKLSIAGRLPGGGSGAARKLIHPFVAFDPRREIEEASDTLETDAPAPAPLRPNHWTTLAIVPDRQGSMAIVNAAISQAGFIGVKIYPPVGFKPSGNADPKIDLALMRLYRWCARYDVPITVHTGPGNRFEPQYADYPAPSAWTEVLASSPELERLHLDLGHFGETARLQGNGPFWIDEALALMERFPGVYADVADQSIPVPDDYVQFVNQRLAAHPAGRARVLYGSDWFMDELEPGSGYSTKDYLPYMRSRMAAAIYGDDAEPFLANNALRFLGFLDERGRPNRANQNFKRLAAFYGQQALPPWLR